jgi:hypothetical protein
VVRGIRFRAVPFVAGCVYRLLITSEIVVSKEGRLQTKPESSTGTRPHRSSAARKLTAAREASGQAHISHRPERFFALVQQSCHEKQELRWPRIRILRWLHRPQARPHVRLRLGLEHGEILIARALREAPARIRELSDVRILGNRIEAPVTGTTTSSSP